MIEILRFIFSSFWIWLGTLILITALGESITAVVWHFRRKGGGG